MGTGIAPNLSIAENLILKSYRGTDDAYRAGRLQPQVHRQRQRDDASASMCAHPARAR